MLLCNMFPAIKQQCCFLIERVSEKAMCFALYIQVQMDSQQKTYSSCYCFIFVFGYSMCQPKPVALPPEQKLQTEAFQVAFCKFSAFRTLAAFFLCVLIIPHFLCLWGFDVKACLAVLSVCFLSVCCPVHLHFTSCHLINLTIFSELNAGHSVSCRS